MTENTNRPPEAQDNQAPLESWKEIATYLNRTVRTVKRWEKAEALPVRRHLHQARSSVYAYPSELEAWKAARQPGFDQAPLAMPWRRPIPALGFALTLLLALVSVASGPILTPPGALAQESGGMVARQVWAGPGVEVWHGLPSPDGRYYTYVDWQTGDLAVRELATGETRRLTHKGTWLESSESARSSAVSPDGKYVAYAWFNEEFFYDLRLVGLNGSSPRVLYRNEELDYIHPHGWSPDGRYILALFQRKDRTTQVVLVSAADGSVRVLKSLDWGYTFKMDFSPDGRYIVYDFPSPQDSEKHDIFLLASDGAYEIKLVEHPANDLFPVWTPEGNRIVFLSDRTGAMGAWALAVAEGKPQGMPRLVKKDMASSVLMGFTHDGSFYYGVNTGMQDVYVATLDLRTGNVEQSPTRPVEKFVGTNLSPDWSADGKYLADLSERGPVPAVGSAVLCIRSRETGQVREISPQLHSFGLRIRLFPDGQSFLAQATDGKGRHGLYRIDAQTGEVTAILQVGPDESIYKSAPSPDGESVFYIRRSRGPAAKPQRVMAFELSTGQENEIYRATPPSFFIGELAVSPDGRQLALTTNDAAVVIIPAAGGQPRELLRGPKRSLTRNLLAWTPDGEAILFGKVGPQQETEVWRIPVEGGEPQPLGLAMVGLRDLRVHPDGQRIAFTAGQGKAELWALENFLPKPETKAAQVKE